MKNKNTNQFNHIATEPVQVRFEQVDQEYSGQRLDNYLIARLKGVPKSVIYRIIRKGEVRVNKKRARPEYKLQADDMIRIPPMHVAPQAELPNPNLSQVANLASRIIYEDTALLIVNKPSGLAVHGGSGLNFGLIEGLRSLRPQSQFLELVHRLDRDTSGLLMVAKKRSVLRALHTQLRENTVDKRYLALVSGAWDSKCKQITAALLKHTLPSGERIMQVSPEGKPSLTKFKVVDYLNGQATLIEARPITGRTHQIRVHCKAAGYPILGDDKYGQIFSQLEQANFKPPRLFLHASQLSFYHPKLEQDMRFEAPLEAELKQILQQYKKK